MTDFSIEKSIDGPVIGLDEVGRGPLAGPVVSCGCLFNRYDRLPENIKITDSKKHTAKQRKKLFSLFKKLQEEYGKFTKKEFEASDTLDTRSRILSVAIARYKDQTGDRKLPFFEGMSLYLDEGGTKAEYLAQFLTSTREELNEAKTYYYVCQPHASSGMVGVKRPG